MEFNNKLGSIQQQLTSTNIGVLRRQALLKELNLQKGQTIIDIGCGGGHLVKKYRYMLDLMGKLLALIQVNFK